MADASGGFAVEGMQELNRLLKNAPKDVRLAIRDEYRTVAEPVRSTAETLAASSIRRSARSGHGCEPASPKPGLRGAPAAWRQKPRHGPDDVGPTSARLLATRATQPALRQHEHRIEADFDRMLGRLVPRLEHRPWLTNS